MNLGENDKGRAWEGLEGLKKKREMDILIVFYIKNIEYIAKFMCYISECTETRFPIYLINSY